jgi:hypothetical protein
MATGKKRLYIKVHTPEFRVSFPQVFQPKAVNPKDTPKYSVVALIPKSIDLSKPITNKKGKEISLGMKKAMIRLLKNQYPDKFAAHGTNWKDWADEDTGEGRPVLPFRDGDKDKKYSKQKGYPGHFFVRFSSKDMPGLVDIKRGKDGKRLPITEEKGGARILYPGCYARAVISMTTFEYMGKYGVTCYLNSLMKTKDGEPLGNRADAQTDFDDFGGEVEADDDMDDDQDSSDDNDDDDSDSFDEDGDDDEEGSGGF